MTLIKWKPKQLSINEFDQMINNIFNDGWNFNSQNTSQLPAVDIAENNDKFILSADFPGFEKKDINLSIEDGVLRLSATKDDGHSDVNYTLKERESVKMERSFTLPESILEKKIDAKFKNGMLQINIPKAEEVKPDVQKIKIS